MTIKGEQIPGYLGEMVSQLVKSLSGNPKMRKILELIPRVTDYPATFGGRPIEEECEREDYLYIREQILEIASELNLTENDVVNELRKQVGN